MKIIHLADLHLGFRQFHRLSPSGINQREADVASTFRKTIDQVIALRPDAVVIAGDIFHTARPTNTAIIHAYRQLQRLTAALPDAVVILIAGNHDRPRASETGSILRLFSALGIHVVDAMPARLPFPDRSLSVLAVPDMAGNIPPLDPEPGSQWNVLLLHGEVQGVLPKGIADRGTAEEIPVAALNAPRWSYIALGHYHVHREVAANACYAGSIDYTSSNPWGEMVEERKAGFAGKGFIEIDLASGERTFHPLDASRALVDLPAIAAAGASLDDLNRAVAQAIDGCELDGKIVRLIVRDVSLPILRELDPRPLREARRRAFHFHFDARRPARDRSETAVPMVGGRRATLEEMLGAYLERRAVAAGLNPDALVKLGNDYLREAAE